VTFRRRYLLSYEIAVDIPMHNNPRTSNPHSPSIENIDMFAAGRKDGDGGCESLGKAEQALVKKGLASSSSSNPWHQTGFMMCGDRGCGKGIEHSAEG
jgi:hypothetical protein